MIEIQNLCRSFGELEAVRHLNLMIPRGELFCFIGPNGAGKTTTIKMLTGLLRPTQGSVRINGLDVQRQSVEVRRITGYIPDTPFLYERLTAEEYFHFVGELYQIPEAAVRQRQARWFELFGLEEYARTLIKDLSHGTRQRLVYAATFLHEPQVLFVDEPFIGLDPHTIRLIRELLREMTRAGMTVFLTTHILALAEDIADRVGIIRNGELIEEGTLAELKTRRGFDRLEDIFLSLTSRT